MESKRIVSKCDATHDLEVWRHDDDDTLDLTPMAMKRMILGLTRVFLGTEETVEYANRWINSLDDSTLDGWVCTKLHKRNENGVYWAVLEKRA